MIKCLLFWCWCCYALGGSLAIKCVFMNNQSCLIKPTLIDLNLYELHYYPFIIDMKRCDGGYNAVEDHLVEYILQIKWKTWI